MGIRKAAIISTLMGLGTSIGVTTGYFITNPSKAEMETAPGLIASYSAEYRSNLKKLESGTLSHGEADSLAHASRELHSEIRDLERVAEGRPSSTGIYLGGLIGLILPPIVYGLSRLEGGMEDMPTG